MKIFARLSRLLLSFLFAFGVNNAQAAFSQSESPAVATPKPMLQGGVKHSESLPALSDNLLPGKDYSDALLIPPGTKFSGQWLYIPAWYAGTRHCDEVVVYYRHDFETGEDSAPLFKQRNRQDDVAGCQKDRQGGIWDFKEVPLIQRLESDLVDVVLFVKKVTPIFGSEEKIVIKYDELSIELNKGTNKIVQVTQQEQINSITCPRKGVLHIEISAKAFDENGDPEKLEQSVIIAKITKPYKQKDRFNGRDLRPLFKEYLTSHNLENLVPLDLLK